MIRGHFRALSLVALLMLIVVPAHAADRVDPSTLTGKLIMGFQGWFACPGDRASVGWGHLESATHGPLVPTVDMLPDVSELPANERCPTSMTRADGQQVELFSDERLAPVELQFAWMQRYGLDGVAAQRFATSVIDPRLLRANDAVLGNVRRAAEDHGRVFFVMYDLSGLKSAELPELVRDWDRLEREGLTGSPAYQRHRGHPLLGVWGLGFAGRDLSPAQAETLLDGLARASAPHGGVTFLGGLPAYWRTRRADAASDPAWDRVWRRLAVISPWSVGRFGNDAGADRYRRDELVPDEQAARALGADYMPVVFPGFSWANLKRSQNRPKEALDNQIPRDCGRFYWRQVANALGAGATMLYGAMFDEVNEGTAMFKLLPDQRHAPVQGIPAGDRFVTLDADGCTLPSDWYLRLAGATTTALHGHAKPGAALPLPLPAN